MSAYLVDREDISYLIEAAEKFEAYIKIPNGSKTANSYEYVNKFSHEDKELLGQMLWNENVKSVEGRYPDTRETRQYPGTIEAAEDVAYYIHPQKNIFNREMDFDPAQVFKSIAHYKYQSCEHKEWKESDSYDFCHRLMEAVGGKLYGSDSATWGSPIPWSIREAELRKKVKSVYRLA